MIPLYLSAQQIKKIDAKTAAHEAQKRNAQSLYVNFGERYSDSSCNLKFPYFEQV